MFSYSLNLASTESIFDRILERDPVEKENATTPRSITHIENIFSDLVSAVISPYPTVVIVVIV